MARSRRKKTTRDRLIDAALCAAPAPVRSIASNPIGFRFLLIGGALLMATGIMTLDWSDGMPHFKIDRNKASQVKKNLVNDLGQQVQGWNLQGNGHPQSNSPPPGLLTQTPANPYQQPVWIPNSGPPLGGPYPANGVYNPNGAYHQPATQWPASQSPASQWPASQWPAPQNGSVPRGNFRQ